MEYPPHIKFKDTQQEYVPVVDAPYPKDKKFTYWGGDNPSSSFFYDSLSRGSIIMCENRVYGIVEARQHGVLVRYDDNSGVMLYEWEHVAPVRIDGYFLERLDFAKSHATLHIEGRLEGKVVHPWVKEIAHGMMLYYVISTGDLVIGDICFPKKVRYVHEMQYFLLGLTGDISMKSLHVNTGTLKMMKKRREEGHIAGKTFRTPTQLDFQNRQRQVYQSRHQKRRYVKKKVITPNGTDYIATKRARGYKYISEEDKRFMEENPEFFQ
jgi:hypothetical protein